MTTHAIKLGILSREDYAKRTIAIASGTRKPERDEPKIWFDSLGALAEKLGNDNQAPLRLIVERQPQSLTELESSINLGGFAQADDDATDTPKA